MDIFGKNPTDYRQFRNMAEGVRTSVLESKAQARSLPVHDFHALDNVHTRAEGEAQVVGFVTDNLMAVQSQIDQILYSSFRIPRMVPIKSDIPEGADTFAKQIMDRIGEGAFINREGTNAPSANVSLRKEAYKLHQGGIIAAWSNEDLRQSMQAGIPLDTETINAAVTGSMEHMERVCLSGDAEFSDTTRGLVNQEQAANDAQKVKAVVAGTTLSANTADGNISFIQKEISAMIEDTVEVLGRKIMAPLHVFLPPAEASILANSRVGDGLNNVWQYLRENNEWTQYTGFPLVLERLTECADAGWANANGSGARNNRMILMVNDPMVLEFPVAFEPRVAGTSNATLYGVRVGIEYKIGALNVYRPFGMKYVDNV